MADLESPTIVNELLCFVQNNLLLQSPRDVVRTCVAFYSPETIREAKDIIFNNAINPPSTKNIKRRGTSTKSRSSLDMEDIVDVMSPNGKESLPTFVARNLSNLPAINDWTESFSSLRSEFLELKSYLKDFDLKSLCSNVNALVHSQAAIVGSLKQHSKTPTASISPTDSSRAGGKRISNTGLVSFPPTADDPPRREGADMSCWKDCRQRSVLTNNASDANDLTPLPSHSETHPTQPSITAGSTLHRMNDKTNRRPRIIPALGLRELPKVRVINRTRKRRILVNRFHPETTVTEIGNILSDLDVDYECSKLVTRNMNVYASFVITVKEDSYAAISDPTLWPIGIQIREFFGLPQKVLKADKTTTQDFTHRHGTDVISQPIQSQSSIDPNGELQNSETYEDQTV